MGCCGAVNIGHDDLEQWLQLEYHVIAILEPVTKSEPIEDSVCSEVLVFGRGMDAMRYVREVLGRTHQECRRVILVLSS